MPKKKRLPYRRKPIEFVNGPEDWERIGRSTWVFKPFVKDIKLLDRKQSESLALGTPLWVVWPYEGDPSLQVLMGWVRRSTPTKDGAYRDPSFVSWWEFCYEGRYLIDHTKFQRYAMGQEWQRYFINRADTVGRHDKHAISIRVWMPHPTEMIEIEKRSKKGTQWSAPISSASGFSSSQCSTPPGRDRLINAG